MNNEHIYHSRYFFFIGREEEKKSVISLMHILTRRKKFRCNDFLGRCKMQKKWIIIRSLGYTAYTSSMNSSHDDGWITFDYLVFKPHFFGTDIKNVSLCGWTQILLCQYSVWDFSSQWYRKKWNKFFIFSITPPHKNSVLHWNCDMKNWILIKS